MKIIFYISIIINILITNISFSSDLYKKYQGDYLISDFDFVKSINNTCSVLGFYNRSNEQIEQDQKRCVLSNLKFYSDNFISENIIGLNNQIILYSKSDTDIYIKREELNKESFKLDFKMSIYIKKNGVLKDKVNIYKEIHNIDAFNIEKTYYYLDNNFNLWVLDIFTLEEGALLGNWKKYFIDISNSKIELIFIYSCNYRDPSKEKCNFKTVQ